MSVARSCKIRAIRLVILQDSCKTMPILQDPARKSCKTMHRLARTTGVPKDKLLSQNLKRAVWL